MKRIRRDKGVLYYTLAKDTILSKTLSLKAKALLAILLNLPDNWHFTVAGILPSVQEGREAVMSALKELESAGYLTITQIRDDKGRIRGREFTVLELLPDAPEAEMPIADMPSSAYPPSGDGKLNKTKEITQAKANRKDITSSKELVELFSRSQSAASRIIGKKLSGGSVLARNEAVKAALKKKEGEKGKGGGGE